jgi:hypothetical protein
MDTKRTNRFLGTKGLLGAGALLALAVLFAPATAGAFEHIEHHSHGGHHPHGGHPSHGGLVIGGSFGSSGGYYTDRVETVCVAPAHYERQWVPAQYETFTDSEGCVRSRLVREGCWTEVYVAAQYESRVVRVWVPAAAPSVGIGFGFRF